MNQARRKELSALHDEFQKALGAFPLQDIRDRLEAVAEEEREALANLPDSIQESERGESMQEGIDAMENAVAAFDEMQSQIDEAIQQFENLGV